MTLAWPRHPREPFVTPKSSTSTEFTATRTGGAGVAERGLVTGRSFSQCAQLRLLRSLEPGAPGWSVPKIGRLAQLWAPVVWWPCLSTQANSGPAARNLAAVRIDALTYTRRHRAAVHPCTGGRESSVDYRNAERIR